MNSIKKAFGRNAQPAAARCRSQRVWEFPTSILLSKTHLYYANPVLAILGYRVYEVTFKSNPDFNNEVCLAVVKGGFLKNPSTVEYKVINDTVLYMKEMNK